MKYELTDKKCSIKILRESSACLREVHRLAFLVLKYTDLSYEDQLPSDFIWAHADKCKGGIQYLLENGYIREQPVTYKRGDNFERDDEIYVLTYISGQDFTLMALVCLQDGRCWKNPVRTSDHEFVTEKEFHAITGNHLFRKI